MQVIHSLGRIISPFSCMSFSVANSFATHSTQDYENVKRKRQTVRYMPLAFTRKQTHVTICCKGRRRRESAGSLLFCVQNGETGVKMKQSHICSMSLSSEATAPPLVISGFVLLFSIVKWQRHSTPL